MNIVIGTLLCVIMCGVLYGIAIYCMTGDHRNLQDLRSQITDSVVESASHVRASRLEILVMFCLFPLFLFVC